MKKIVFILFIFTLMFLVGCESKEPILEVNKTSYNMEIGKEEKIEYTLSSGEVDITSSDETIVIIVDGKIKAIKAGEVTVMIKVKGYEISKEIEVVVNPSKALQIVRPSEGVYVNKKLTLTIISDYSYEDGDLLWSSSDETLATVEKGIVKPLKIGEVVIKVESLLDDKFSDEVTLIIENYKISISNFTDTIYVGESLQINFNLTPANSTKQYIFTSNDPNKATIDENGAIECLASGTVKLTVALKDNVNISSYVYLTIKESYTLELCCPSEELVVGSTITLETLLIPSAKEEIIWASSNPKIALVKNNEFTFLTAGEITITATLKNDSNISATISLEIKLDPIKLMEKLNITNPYVKEITTYGYNPDTRVQTVYGSVTKYFFSDLNLIEKIVPINTNIYAGQTATPAMIIAAEPLKLVRPGIYLEQIKHIIYHDTGNHTPNANALAHANYLVSNDNATNRARSWHYTVDENYVYHHIPDNEVTWQGDSYIAYAQSIGIETCVDYGSDLETTWHRTAKLMAGLLLKYNLTPADIKQHYDMNGKDCPRALRNSNMYTYAIDLVIAEYIVQKNLSGYTIAMESSNTTYVDNRGRVIKLPASTMNFSYKITIKNNNGYNESVTVNSTLQKSS